MVEVKMKTSYAGPKGTCPPGKTIPLESEEAAGLVDGGYAEYVDVPPTLDDEPDTNGLPDGLIALKGSMFELPDGSKVKGKAKAIAALDAYNASLENNENK